MLMRHSSNLCINFISALTAHEKKAPMKLTSILFTLVCSSLLLIACDDTENSEGSAGMMAGEAMSAGTTAGAEYPAGQQENTSPWGDVCQESSDCEAPTDFCVKQPGAPEGYCTYACNNNAHCSELNAPETWSCNTLSFSGCEDIPSNWCGPASELTDFPGVLIECP